MKLSAQLDVVWHLFALMKIALIPTIKYIWLNPCALRSPRVISQTFLACVWRGGMGDGINEGRRPVKTELITPNAQGVVLDLGAGHGHTAQYLDRSKVTHYVALEPNTQMHSYIRAEASSAGFHESDGTLIILSCGAEDPASTLSALNGRPVDTITSVLTLCSVPEPQKTIHNLVRDVLKPKGGVFLFYEHVLSTRADVAWWQRFWAPVWQIPFDGCRLDRPTDIYFRDLKVVGDDGAVESPWAEISIYREPGDDQDDHLLLHQVGKFVKK